MSAAEKFLDDFNPRPLNESYGAGLKSEKLILGQDQTNNPLELVVLSSNNNIQTDIIQKAQKKRQKHRASPVLLTVIRGDKADLCGPSGEQPPVQKGVELKIVDKFCRTALKQPNRHRALRFCSHFLPSIETELFGLNNKGLLSYHYLAHGVKQRPDYEQAKTRAKNISHFEQKNLLEGLGFHISSLDNSQLTYILKSQDKKRALAVLLNPLEDHQSKAQRFNELSPIHYAMDKAERENMPWVVMVQDNHIRLYSAQNEFGASTGDRTETYIECRPSLLSEENLGLLPLIFSAEALSENGSLSDILAKSKRFAEDAAKNLKNRIYNEVVPLIAKGIVDARQLSYRSSEELQKELKKTYEMTLNVLFRMLFIAHAEDKDFLPYNTNSAYRDRSLKKKAQELSALYSNSNSRIDEARDNHWQDISCLWKAIDKGNSEWGIMAYNGGLFSSEKNVSEIGCEISKISVSNKFFAPALKSLLLMDTQERSLAPLDFRFIGPKEFGTIYEGLLESNLSIADADLTLDKKDIYVPLKKNKKTKIIVKKGEVYLHNQSGARKQTGSYYTKSFVVESILDKSLNPALEQHFKRLDALSDKDAAKEFFNFFTADIAMGSGHFLVAAVDRIEKGMANYLNNRPLKGVQDILDKTQNTAEKNLQGLSKDYFPAENRKFLARCIARHCIYGVDNNELAVQLTKLSLWSHTFIPGLPLSYFNHNLRCGNSLVGIGTIEELHSDLKNEQHTENLSFKHIDTEKLIGMAKKPLKDMRQAADLNAEEIKKKRNIQKQIDLALKNTKALFDVVLFNRIQNTVSGFKLREWIDNLKSIYKSEELKKARGELKNLQVFHFPIAFPEVFLRKRPGFDVIIGNPPWEEITLEKHAFWARYSPGLRGVSQRERERTMKEIKRDYPHLEEQYKSELKNVNNFKEILKQTFYMKSSSGDPDLYKFFCWRFWNLICSENGHIGVVLKGSVGQAKGSTNFRKTIFQKSKTYITIFINNLGWVFDVVDGIRIVTLCIEKISNPTQKSIYIQGPFTSRNEFNLGKKTPPAMFTKKQILSWTDSASLPSFPHKDSLGVFLQMKKTTDRLDLNNSNSWRARPYTELHATNEKHLMDLQSKKRPKGFWPVFTGESFNIWEQDTGKYYAWADSKQMINWLDQKRRTAHKDRRSVWSEFSRNYINIKNTLPCFKPRIAFRDIGSADRPRTVHVSLIPPKVFVVNQAPHFIFPRGDEKDEAFLLGILSSMPLDWYARLFISTNHVNFFLLNTFPIPRPARTNPLWKRAAALSGRLACPDKRFAKWAKAVGVKYGPLDEDKKNNMIYELDAVAAHLYGLSEKQLVHIFETFHKHPEYYHSRKQAVLKYYQFWKEKLAKAA